MCLLWNRVLEYVGDDLGHGLVVGGRDVGERLQGLGPDCGGGVAAPRENHPKQEAVTDGA